MQQVKRITKAAKLLLMLVLSATIFSFWGNFGGDVFKIYVNKKLVVEQFVHKNEAVKILQLDQGNYNDEVEVHYSHCGISGKGRSIAIKDGQNRLLKEWNYPDLAKSGMSFKVKDILSLQKNKVGTLHLYYSSKELPAGRLLTAINASNDNNAKR